MADLRFDEKSHTYWLGDEKLISVTGVLREAKLFDYTSGHGMYMEKGTYIHAMTELEDAGVLVPERVANPALPYVDGWRLFKEEMRIEVLGTEEAVYNPLYKYAGKLDRRIRIKGKEAVIDIKSGLKAPWHSLQTIGYAKCYDRPMLRFALYLADDGTYQLEEHSDMSDWDVFRAALAIVSWKRKKGIVKI